MTLSNSNSLSQLNLSFKVLQKLVTYLFDYFHSLFLFAYVLSLFFCLCTCFLCILYYFSCLSLLGFLCILHMHVLFHSILFFFCFSRLFSVCLCMCSVCLSLSLFLSFSLYVDFLFLFICFDSCLLCFTRLMCACQQASKKKKKNVFQMFTNSPVSTDQ